MDLQDKVIAITGGGVSLAGSLRLTAVSECRHPYQS
jgi:hypothetical protein